MKRRRNGTFGRNNWSWCRRHARAAARARRPVSVCPYKAKAWRSHWLRIYEETLQERIVA